MEFEIIRLLTGIIILVSANFGKADDLHHQQLPPSTDFKKLFQEWDDSESILKSHLKVYGMNVITKHQFLPSSRPSSL